MEGDRQVSKRAGRGLLVCYVCGGDVTTGQANVMVNDRKFRDQGLISNLRIACKSCTRKMDEAAGGKSIDHAIWELDWLRNNPWNYVGKLLNEVVHPNETRDHWELESIDAFVDILIELLPEEVATGLLQYYFAPTEWDREGPRSEQFRLNRNLTEDERPDPV